MAGAFSSDKLEKIFANCDSDELKNLATPKKDKRARLSSAEISLIKAMSNGKYTQSDIADQLGVSTSTVSAIINGTY